MNVIFLRGTTQVATPWGKNSYFGGYYCELTVIFAFKTVYIFRVGILLLSLNDYYVIDSI